MKQLLLRLYHWLGRLLGELDTPRYRRETDWLPRGGKQSAAAAPPRPHLGMRTPQRYMSFGTYVQAGDHDNIKSIR